MKADFRPSLKFRFTASLMIVATSLSLAADPTYAGMDELIEEVCGAEPAPSSAPENQEKISQWKTYCAAAKSSDKAATINSALWKIWAGVATVCTTSCALSFTDTIIGSLGTTFNTYLSACGGANTMAGVTDGLMTKNFRTAITAITGSVGGAMMNGMMNKNKKSIDGLANNSQVTADDLSTSDISENSKIAENKKEGFKRTRETDEDRDRGACLTAITASMTAFTKRSTMKTSEESARANLQSAQALIGQQTAADTTRLGTMALTGTSAASAGAANHSGTRSSLGEGGRSSADPCSTAANGGNSQSFISCAVSNDPSLPRFVSHPDFVKDFPKLTGMSLDKFLNESQHPSNSILAGMVGGGLNSPALAKLADVHRQMESYSLNNNVAGSAYSRGGAAQANSGQSNEPDLGALMAGVLGQLNPQEGEKSPGMARDIGFNILGRSPAAVAEDRTVSIFDRITVRYLTIDKKNSYGIITP